MRRFLKQLIYGIFYLAFFVALGYGIYYFFIIPGASCFDNIKNQNEEDVDCGGLCVECIYKNLQSLKIFPGEAFLNSDNTLTIAVKISNPNNQLGIERLPYILEIYNKNNEKISSLLGDAFIYPGEEKFIIHPALQIDPNLLGNAVLKIDNNQNWQTAAEFPFVQALITEKKLELTDTEIIITGKVNNANAFPITADLVGILINDLGLRQNISKVSMPNINAFSMADFRIVIPAPGLKIKPILDKNIQLLIYSKRK